MSRGRKRKNNPGRPLSTRSSRRFNCVANVTGHIMLLFTEPVLTTTSAFFISLSFAAAFVGGLYLSKNARVIFASVKYDGDGKTPRGKLQHERWRDDPDVIRARIIVVMVATLACCLAVFAIIWACSDRMVTFHICFLNETF